jgi:hypothetical protein
MNSQIHNSSRSGLKVADLITDGPEEDNYLRPGPGRFMSWLLRPVRAFRAWRHERQERIRDQQEVLRRLRTLLDRADGFQRAIHMEGQRIAASEQRAPVRLQALQANHDVLRDTLNAHADEITKLQQKVN